MHPSSNQPEDGRPPSSSGYERLRQGRDPFVVDFPTVCDSIDVLLKAISASGPKGSSEPLRKIAEGLASAAGAAGFPKVSERAAELARMAAQADKGFHLEVARGVLEAIRETYSHELASPPASASDTAPASQIDGGIRILVVDQCEEERQALADYLQLGGYDPVPVANRDMTIDAARQYQPAGVVIEVDLPGVDGFAVCREMKADPELAGIPVIVLTAKADPDHARHGPGLGAPDYVAKPVDPREVLMRIDEVLRGPGDGK